MVQSVQSAFANRQQTPARGLPWLLDLLIRWQERAFERKRLAAMDDHVLRDIGLSRADIDQEVRKPFWQS